MKWPATSPLRIMAVVALFQLLIGVMGVILADSDPRLLPGQRDDDPFGNLYLMNNTGSLVWIVLALLALAAALYPNRYLLGAAIAAWAIAGVTVIAVTAAGSDVWGWNRPSNAAWALAVVSAGIVCAIDESRSPSTSAEP